MTTEQTNSSSGRFYARVAIVAAICAIIGYGVSYLIRPRYKSTELIMFPQSSGDSSISSMIPGKLGASAEPGSVGIFGNALTSTLIGSNRDTALGIIKSLSCMRDVVQKNDLASVYGVSEGKAVKTLIGRVDASIDKTGFLEIDASDEDPTRAAAIVKSVEAYLKEMSEKLSLNISKRNREFVQQRVLSSRKELAREENRLASAVERKPMAQVEDREKSLVKLQEEAGDARVKADSAKEHIVEVESRMGHLLRETGSFPGKMMAIESLYKGLTSLALSLQERRIKLSDAAKIFTKSNPQTLEAQKEFDSATAVANSIFQSQLHELNTGNEPSLIQAKASYKALASEARDYAALVADLQAQLSRNAATYIHNEMLRAHFKASIERYEKLELELDLARIAEDRDPARFEIVDPAVPSDEIVYPRRAVAASIVFILIFVAQVFPRLFTSTRGPADL